MKIKRITVLFLVFVFAILSISFSSAEDEDGIRYSHFKSVSATLDISGGVASSYGSATPRISSETRMVTILVVLQKYDDGVWRIVKSWSATAYNTTASAGGTWSVPSGYQYRTYVSAKVYDGDGHLLEHVTKTSGIVYY